MLLSLIFACGTAPGDDSSIEEVVYETYTCGWEKRDPGNLVATGAAIGDVLADLEFVDQCGESFRIWDMYSKYFLLFYTAAW